MPRGARLAFPVAAPEAAIVRLLLLHGPSHPHGADRPHHLGLPHGSVHPHGSGIPCSLHGACVPGCLVLRTGGSGVRGLRSSSPPPRPPPASPALCTHTARLPDRGPRPVPGSTASTGPGTPSFPPQPPGHPPGLAGAPATTRHRCPPARAATRPAAGTPRHGGHSVHTHSSRSALAAARPPSPPLPAPARRRRPPPAPAPPSALTGGTRGLPGPRPLLPAQASSPPAPRTSQGPPSSTPSPPGPGRTRLLRDGSGG